MRYRAAMGALALILFVPDAEAFGPFGPAGKAHTRSRSYANFLAGYLDFREGNLDSALEWYQKALKYSGEEPDILFEIANIQVKKGRLPEARESLRRALEKDEGHTRSRYLQAGILAATGDRVAALAEYERVVREAPENDEAYLHISTLYAEQGRFDRSEEVLAALIERNPDSHLGYYYRARVLASQKKFEAALADYDKALAILPGFDAALVDSGAVLEILDRNAEAEERYKRALHAAPNNPFIRERLGRVLVREKKIDQAVGQYEELKKFSSNSTDVRAKLGLLYLDRDRFDDAINEFTFVLAAEPENSQVRFFLGAAYEEKGALQEAADAFRRIPDGAPAYRDATLRLAMLLSRQKKADEAIEVTRKLREKFPEEPDLMVFLGGLLEESKRYEEALAIVTQATVKAPASPGAWFSHGVISDKLGNADQVVASMEKVISLDPKHATALNYLGYTFADRNIRLPEAEKLILRALEIRPDDGYFIDSLAWVRYRQGDFPRAEEGLRRALKFVPDDPVVLEHLGDVLAAQGKVEEAAAQYERAIAKGHEKPAEVSAKLATLRKSGTAGK